MPRTIRISINEPQSSQTPGLPWYLYDLDRPEAKPVNGLPTRGHFSFGHDFRFSELQGAVAFAQLEKIDRFNARRRELVEKIETELCNVPGVRLAYVYPEDPTQLLGIPGMGTRIIGAQG